MQALRKYTRALDKGDGATYASTYTVDGQFGARKKMHEGPRGALEARRPVARAEASRRGRAAVSHGVEPLDFFQGQGPRAVSRLLPDGLRATGREAPLRIVAAGQSFDVMERV